MNEQPIVGDWCFDTESAVLRQPGCTKRLEDRSARTLALLCRRRGEVVSKAQILEEVWKGRSVSDNSVAIVIADLRRALGEISREPRHIETVGKRGYRLTVSLEASPSPEPPTTEPARARFAYWAYLAIAAMGALTIVLLLRATQPAPPVALLLVPVRNDTGDSHYDPLAKALTLLVQDRASRISGVNATDPGLQPSDARKGRQLEIRSHLILWNDTPTLALAAIDRADGKVLWSGMAVGPPNAIAGATIRELAAFQKRI